ncbi:hypothetical protein AVEN_136521-1 [Araneus ventricosus]|uniref:Uncharacterized protein n=1 Tax=Araneus ventricosus TaxID=182803 RepID=A0A4Y2KKT3_ARAVE|nr:hypothetical protein AVEN_136521-1 [Araneus ventricosus]
MEQGTWDTSRLVRGGEGGMVWGERKTRNFHYPTLIECPWHNTNKLVKVLLADLQINFSPLDFAQIRTDGIPNVPSPGLYGSRIYEDIAAKIQ